MLQHRIYTGKIIHSRVAPVKHSFCYNAFFLCLPLNDLNKKGSNNFIFGYNRWRCLSIHDKDYLYENRQSIKTKIEAVLKKQGYAEHDFTAIFLLTVPKVLGYVFNPVSFYYCYDAAGVLQVIVAEVNNTYHERHLYIFSPSRQSAEGAAEFHCQLQKRFFVSPFNNMKGDYDFHSTDISDGQLSIKFDLYREGAAVLYTKMAMHPKPWSAKNLMVTLLAMPLFAALTSTRIAWHAIMLKRRGMRTLLKPTPTDALTIRHKKTLWHRTLLSLHHRFHRKH